MNQNNEFLAGVLRQAARALASYASRELLEKHPEAEKGFEPGPFAGWQNWLSVRLDELAAAISANRPQLFIAQVHWGKAVLEARGISPESFRHGLECLREVLVGELPEQVRPLASEYVGQALEAFDDPPADLSARLLPDTEMGRLASTYLLVLLEGDRRRASRLILEALDRGHDVRDLHLQVLLPAQEELGRMWLANEINVAEEHFASQTTKIVMAQLLPRATLQPSNGKTMIAAAVAGNQHDIGLQAVADFFEMDGWRTVLLGANVPARDLVQAVDCFAADLLGLSVSQTIQFQAVKTAIQAVRGSARDTKVKILLGGRAFTDPDDLAKELGADGYAALPAQAVALGRQLVGLD
ncbi:MAG: cobalamin B12-binding domain-containing protein [Planctomycetota bacterium]|jgi:methanogenic corrinoid protein MtbC1